MEFVAQKGMVEDDMFAPPGMEMKIDVEEDPGYVFGPLSLSTYRQNYLSIWHMRPPLP